MTEYSPGCFIGGHLTADLLRQGFSAVRAVDIKPPNQWFQTFPQADNRSLDLREKDNCYRALENVDHVYTLAADMGGMGFIENNKALCMPSVTINTHPERFRIGVKETMKKKRKWPHFARHAASQEAEALCRARSAIFRFGLKLTFVSGKGHFR